VKVSLFVTEGWTEGHDKRHEARRAGAARRRRELGLACQETTKRTTEVSTIVVVVVVVERERERERIFPAATFRGNPRLGRILARRGGILTGVVS